jgi:hypothetical protein
MCRKARDNALAQLANVAREACHFVARYPRVGEQHAGLAFHDNGVVLEKLALVDQHTLCNLRQHGVP